MMKFRKKQVAVEAMQYIDDNQYQVVKWMNEGLPDIAQSKGLASYKSIIVKAPGRDLMAFPGSWIIKASNGDCCPIPSEIFDKSYEPVSSNSETNSLVADCGFTPDEDYCPGRKYSTSNGFQAEIMYLKMGHLFGHIITDSVSGGISSFMWSLDGFVIGADQGFDLIHPKNESH